MSPPKNISQILMNLNEFHQNKIISRFVSLSNVLSNLRKFLFKFKGFLKNVLGEFFKHFVNLSQISQSFTNIVFGQICSNKGKLISNLCKFHANLSEFQNLC